MSKSSINIKPVKAGSETHNQRKHPMKHVRSDLTKNNEMWGIETTIHNRKKEIFALCEELSERKMQCNATPIREGVVNLLEAHNLEDVKNLCKVLERVFKIKAFQIYVHNDEGRWTGEKWGDGEWIPNHHAQIIFDWQNKETGKMLHLEPDDMRRMQTIVAETLDMVRGREGSRAPRAEAQAYKAQQKLKDATEKKKLLDVYGCNADEIKLWEELKLSRLKEQRRQDELNHQLLQRKRKLKKLNAKLSKKIEKSKSLETESTSLSETLANLIAETLKSLKKKLKSLKTTTPATKKVTAKPKPDKPAPVVPIYEREEFLIIDTRKFNDATKKHERDFESTTPRLFIVDDGRGEIHLQGRGGVRESDFIFDSEKIVVRWADRVIDLDAASGITKPNVVLPSKDQGQDKEQETLDTSTPKIKKSFGIAD